MARRAFNFAALIFLLLAVLAVALGAWSYFDAAALRFTALERSWAVRSIDGMLEIWSQPAGGPAAPVWAVSFRLPYVALVALLAVVPVLWIVWRKDQPTDSRHPARCPRCGYDLRASTNKCPECGTPLWPLLAAVEATMPGGPGPGRFAIRDAARSG